VKKLLTFLFFCMTCHSVWSQGIYSFEENKGQWDNGILFRASIPGGYLFVTKSSLRYQYFHPEDIVKFSRHKHSSDGGSNLRMKEPDNLIRVHVVDVEFKNTNGFKSFVASQPEPSKINYFLGNDPAKWASGVGKFGEIEISNIYDNIDLRLYSQNESIKYDLILHPGSKLSDVQLEFNGADEVREVANELEVITSIGSSKELAPFSYQNIKGEKEQVACQYQLKGNKLMFSLPEGYDKRETLVIDPELIFSTYSGSVADNWGFTATYDEAGNVYSGGITFDFGFPATTGAYQITYGGNTDVGILKYDSTGQDLLFATYIGGSEADTPNSMIVNHKGELVIYGTTSSSNFPVSNSAYQKDFKGGTPMSGLPGELEVPVGGVPFNNGSDIYLFKLSEDGSQMVASTYLGGLENDGIMLRNFALTKNYGDQFRGEVNIDKDDNIYIASYTSSVDFPIVNGVQTSYGGGSHDGIVAVFNEDLSSLLKSTFLGGNDMDGLYSVKIDPNDNIVVAGGTISNDYPVTNNVIKNTKTNPLDIDGVITKIRLDTDTITASTFLGTNAYDQTYFVEIDSSGNVYVLGQTQGQYPVTSGVYSNPNSGQFIHKLNSKLDSTYFSTVFGSGNPSPNIRPTAFLVNECENLLISGWGGGINSAIDGFGASTGYVGGNTLNMPLTDNAFQRQTDGSDFYLIVFLQDAKQLLYATYFGGLTSRGDHVDGGTSRFDNRGIVYQSVCAGCGGFDDFPTTPGVWSNTNNSPNCNNAVFKFDVTQLKADFTTNSFEFDQPGLNQGCWPLEVVFLNRSIGGITFDWDFGNGETSQEYDSIYITYEDPGIYDVSLTVTDIATCVREDIARGSILVNDQTYSIMNPQKICFGDEIRLTAGGGTSYHWEPEGFLDDPNSRNPMAQPDTTTWFKVWVTNGFGCVGEDSVLITVVPDFEVDFESRKENSCFDSPDILFTNLSEGADNYSWDMGNGDELSDENLNYNYHDTDTFLVVLNGIRDICHKSKAVPVSSIETIIPNIITPNGDGKNDSFQVLTDQQVHMQIYNRWGEGVFENEDYRNEFTGAGLSTGIYYYELEFTSDGTSCRGWLQILK